MQKKSTRVCFIFNPVADRNRSSRHINWLNREAGKRWEEFEIVITQKNQDIVGLAREKAGNFDIVVACGGDGTINQVVNGIVGTSASLGVLPIGSGNDFVKTMHLNKTLPECMEILHQGYQTNIDLIRYKGDCDGWCANTIGIGLDGWANYYARNYKFLRGHAVYVLGALKAAIKFRGSNMNLKIDEVQKNDHFLMITVCNGKWEGGNFFVAPDADMTDGLLDLLTINNLPLPTVLSYLPRFRWGPSPNMKGVKLRQCKDLEVTSEIPLAVHSDGEHLSKTVRYLKLSVKKNVLPVITPKNY